MCPAPVRGNAQYPAPTAQDALDVAMAAFENDSRIDMAQIAVRLGVGRSTLYRWVGDREALVDQVLTAATERLARSAKRRVRGHGLDRVVSAVRAQLEGMTRYEPLRRLAGREPQLVVQVFLDADSACATSIRERLRHQLREDLPEVVVPDDVIDVLSATNLSVVWASLVTGQDARIDPCLAILRIVVGAQPS